MVGIPLLEEVVVIGWLHISHLNGFAMVWIAPIGEQDNSLGGALVLGDNKRGGAMGGITTM